MNFAWNVVWSSSEHAASIWFCLFFLALTLLWLIPIAWWHRRQLLAHKNTKAKQAKGEL